MNRAKSTRALVALTLTLSLACNSGPTYPVIDSADLRVLFVGNSLTAANALPSMVQVIAEAAGESFASDELVAPNFSLEDHWVTGAANAIRQVQADVVVMQQGPSSLPENQVYLRDWTQVFAEEIRANGGEPALFMVWPDVTRTFAFEAVHDSYQGAAQAVNGIFIPAGDAWTIAWEEDASLALYASDGFHPSTLGSLLSALTIFGVLYDRPLAGLPTTLEPTSPGLEPIELDAELAGLLYRAADEAIRRVRLSPAPRSARAPS